MNKENNFPELSEYSRSSWVGGYYDEGIILDGYFTADDLILIADWMKAQDEIS